MSAGWLRVAVGLFFSLALAFGCWRLARSRTVQVFGRLAPRVETAERVVALTFDDGPTPERLEEVLGPLESRGVRATFFVIGFHLAQDPETGRRLVAAGHELGNHTYSHERMILKSPAFVRSEVERTDAPSNPTPRPTPRRCRSWPASASASGPARSSCFTSSIRAEALPGRRCRL